MRFAIISDTHYAIGEQVRDSTLWNRQLLTQSEALADALVESLIAQNIDLIVHCGDLTHDGDLSSIQFAIATLRRTGIPFYATTGNHDPTSHESRAAVAAACGQKKCFYAVRVGDLRFLFLDSNYGHFADGGETEVMNWRAPDRYHTIGVTRAQCEWLAGELERDRVTPTLIVIHHPILAREHYAQATTLFGNPLEGFPTPSLFPYGHGEVTSFATSAPNCLAVLAGHWHIFDRMVKNGVHFIQTGSLIEYPFEYRIVDLVGNRLSFHTTSIATEEWINQSLVTEWNSGWVRGEHEVREFLVGLRKMT